MKRALGVCGLTWTLACAVDGPEDSAQVQATTTIGAEPSNTSATTTGPASGSTGADPTGATATGVPPGATEGSGGPTSVGPASSTTAGTSSDPAATAGETSGSGASGSDMPPREGPLRIMPLGDSITEICGYRPRLWQMLTDAGLDFDFVGSNTQNGNCGVAGADADHEGHGGYLVTDVATSGSAELMAWAAVAPDVVLMHFGTNDVWNGRLADNPQSTAPGTEILDAFDVVVDAFRQTNPDVWFVVAQIIPMAPDATTCDECTLCQACPQGVQTLNAAIPQWAATRSSDMSPILVVDQYAGFDVGADTTDRVHPNDGGAQKMADRWFDVVAPLI